MMRSVSAFMVFYLLIYVISVSIVSLTGMDFATALSGVATTMGGVGPGLAELGPYDNFLVLTPWPRWSSPSTCSPGGSSSSRCSSC